MYARTTTLEIDTMRITVEEALELFEREVWPQLVDREGFRGIYVLTTSEGRGLLVSFWDTAEQADSQAASGWYADILGDLVTLFRSPPGREHYEVRLAIPPAWEPVDG